MTRDEIIRMARDSEMFYQPQAGYIAGLDRLERFAALVSAAEREACETTCDRVYHQHIGPQFGEVRYGIAACKAAIRARGNP